MCLLRTKPALQWNPGGLASYGAPLYDCPVALLTGVQPVSVSVSPEDTLVKAGSSAGRLCAL